MTGSSNITAESLIAAIKAAHGNMSLAASNLGVSRYTAYRYLNRYPTAQEALADERETMVDIAVNVMYVQMVEERNITAAAYVLNNSPEAKRRGWGPRQEHTGPDGGPIRVALTWGDNDADDSSAA